MTIVSKVFLHWLGIRKDIAIRGWSRSEAFGGHDYYLFKRVGESLLYASSRQLGVPCIEGYDGDGDEGWERWKADMAKHGQALIDNANPQLEFEGEDVYRETEQRATEAWLWIAKHHQHLWD